MEENRERIKINPIFIIILVIQILFIILAVVTINGISGGGSDVAEVDINNYEGSEVENAENLDGVKGVSVKLTDEQKTMINSVLYDGVAKNNFDSVPSKDAVVRKGSLYNVYIDDLKVHMLNMSVDIEDLKQSYRVVYRWADEYPNRSIPTNIPVSAFCLYEDEMIYENFGCKDDYNGHGADMVVYGLLRYKLFERKSQCCRQSNYT